MTWTSADLSSMRSGGTYMTAISQEVLNILIPQKNVKMIHWKLQTYLSGANELICNIFSIMPCNVVVVVSFIFNRTQQ